MTGAILTAIWKPIAALLALILGGLGLYVKGRADARQRAENKALQANEKAQERGRDAVAKENRLGGDNADLVDRLRKRDGEWR
jgi:hypothetical protein